MPALNWNELTREELGDVLPGAVVVLPTAATEQHGPHLATGHDAFVVTEITERAAGMVGKEVTVILTPVLAFGSSDHHLPFGGTLSLRTETYLHVVQDLLRSMIASGARRVLVLNGHGGNHELNEIAVRDVALSQPASSSVTLAAGSWWTIAAAAMAERPEFSGVRSPGHAGQLETAMMLAMRPDRVRENRPSRDADSSLGTVIPGVRIEGEVPWTDFDGFTDSPADATADLGALALEIAIQAVADAITRLVGSTPA